MTGDTTGFGIVDLDGGNGADLSPFNVEEVDIVSGDVDDGEEKEGIGDLSMEPLCLVQGKPFDFWSNDFDNVPAHWQEDDCSIDGEC